MVRRASVPKLLAYFSLFVLFCVLCGWLYSNWKRYIPSPHHHWDDHGTCSDNKSRIYLKHLCNDYLNGVVGGSLCEDLCVKKEVEFVRCLGHGVKLHVLLAQWGPHTVVLKTADLMKNNSHIIVNHVGLFNDNNKYLSKEDFISKASMTVSINLGFRQIDEQVEGEGKVNGVLEEEREVKGLRGVMEVVEGLFKECDVSGDGQLSYSEAVVCWSILETDELVFLYLLRGLSPIPDLYGVCGNMYAAQYSSSLPLMNKQIQLIDRRSWQFRARLAISIIEMVKELEKTPYGTLYLCDVKGPNIGIVKDPGSERLIAKTIDLDLSWFTTSSRVVNSMRDKSCISDSDCEFVDCQISCSRGKCSGPVLTNNLQVICRNMLIESAWWWPSLLHHSPIAIQNDLTSLLHDCVRSYHPHINTTIINRLLSLLSNSLHSSHNY